MVEARIYLSSTSEVNGVWCIDLLLLCQATIEQHLAFGATFWGSCNLEQFCLSVQFLSKI